MDSENSQNFVESTGNVVANQNKAIFAVGTGAIGNLVAVCIIVGIIVWRLWVDDTTVWWVWTLLVVFAIAHLFLLFAGILLWVTAYPSL